MRLKTAKVSEAGVDGGSGGVANTTQTHPLECTTARAWQQNDPKENIIAPTPPSNFTPTRRLMLLSAHAEIDPDKKRSHDRVKKDKSTVRRMNKLLASRQREAARQRAMLKNERLMAEQFKSAKQRAAVLVQSYVRGRKERLKFLRIKIALRNKIATMFVSRIMNRTMKNLVHKHEKERKVAVTSVKKRERAASLIQNLWSAAKTNEQKRGRWTEMYIARKNERSLNVERRKELWSKRMMLRTRNETLQRQMLVQEVGGKGKGKGKGNEVLGGEVDEEEEQLKNLVAREKEKRLKSERRIELMELKCCMKGGADYVHPVLLEKRRKVKHKVLGSGVGVGGTGRYRAEDGGKRLKFKDADFLEIELRGQNLTNMDVGGFSDPFFEFTIVDKIAGLEGIFDKKSSFRKKRVSHVIYRSEAKMNTLKPCWDVFRVPLEVLCGKDKNPEAKITIEVLDWDHCNSGQVFVGQHDKIGRCMTTAQEILNLGGGEEGTAGEWIPIYKGAEGAGEIQFLSASLGKDSVDNLITTPTMLMNNKSEKSKREMVKGYTVIEDLFGDLKRKKMMVEVGKAQEQEQEYWTPEDNTDEFDDYAYA